MGHPNTSLSSTRFCTAARRTRTMFPSRTPNSTPNARRWNPAVRGLTFIRYARWLMVIPAARPYSIWDWRAVRVTTTPTEPEISQLKPGELMRRWSGTDHRRPWRSARGDHWARSDEAVLQKRASSISSGCAWDNLYSQVIPLSTPFLSLLLFFCG